MYLPRGGADENGALRRYTSYQYANRNMPTDMSDQNLQALKHALKALIIEAAERNCDPASLDDDAPLFGPDSALALDSLDALQISMAIQKRYGLRLLDSKETRRILSNVNHLAEHVHAWQAARAAQPSNPAQAPVQSA